MTDRKLKTIYPVSGIFQGKVDSVILLGFECAINLQNVIKIIGAIFEKIKILMVGLKKKKRWRYLQQGPRYWIWTWLVTWFRRCVRRQQKINKNIFLVSGSLPGKAHSVMLLGFECTINPQNLIKVVGAIFEKIEILNFFLMWTTHNFRGRGKLKKLLEIFTRGPQISNLNEIGRLV